MNNNIYKQNEAAVCFFRSAVKPPKMKAMLQITEKCNLRCAHCFVESTYLGSEMKLENIENYVIPNFLLSNVTKVTLTGGEPLIHRNIREIISAFTKAEITVKICTNGTLITDDLIEFVLNHNDVHFNVSLDGLTERSHGRFRGQPRKYFVERIKQSILSLGKFGLLHGVLTTPNSYASIDEYDELCAFAKNAGAKYVLMNPLSPFGRGQSTQTLAYSRDDMISLREATAHHSNAKFEVIYIRFPNDRCLPLGNCPMGAVPYVFTNGDIVVCPYAVFAANNYDNDYQPEQFLLKNIFRDDVNIANLLNEYVLPNGMPLDTMTHMRKGCCAIKIAKNLDLSDNDELNE